MFHRNEIIVVSSMNYLDKAESRGISCKNHESIVQEAYFFRGVQIPTLPAIDNGG